MGNGVHLVDGNTEENPYIVSAQWLDFRLLPGSSCINGGSPDPRFNDPDGSRNDIGAIPAEFEYFDGELVWPTAEWVELYCPDPMMAGLPMLPGDTIRAYDTDSTFCGYTFVKDDGSLDSMKVYRSTPDGDYDLGPAPGEHVLFRVNDLWLETVPHIYWSQHEDRIELCRYEMFPAAVIDLDEGWNLVSWNVRYSERVEDLIARSNNRIEAIVGYDSGAVIYHREHPEHSNLFDLDYHHGYWIKASVDTSLYLTRLCIEDDETIKIKEGWNLVGYWPQRPLTVEEGLNSLSHRLICASTYDNGWLNWYRDSAASASLTSMSPGFGYWVYSNRADSIEYPPIKYYGSYKDMSASGRADNGMVSTRRFMFIYGTDIVIDSFYLEDGVGVTAMLNDSIVCGQGVIEDGLLKLTPIYGYDPLVPGSELYPIDGERIFLYAGNFLLFPELIFKADDIIEIETLYTMPPSPSSPLPGQYYIYQNYPNPFNAETAIKFYLPDPTEVEVSIYNILGQKVTTLTTAVFESGDQIVTWDSRDGSGRECASGVYFYRVKSGDFEEIRKMMLLK